MRHVRSTYSPPCPAHDLHLDHCHPHAHLEATRLSSFSCRRFILQSRRTASRSDPLVGGNSAATSGVDVLTVPRNAVNICQEQGGSHKSVFFPFNSSYSGFCRAWYLTRLAPRVSTASSRQARARTPRVLYRAGKMRARSTSPTPQFTTPQCQTLDQ
jgi:hypothetical protein